MVINLTEQERQLLFQTVATSSYAGQLSKLVVSVLEKLEEAAQIDSEDKRVDH